MKKRLLFVVWLAIAIPLSGVAQAKNGSLQWLEVIFFHKKVFNRIFFEYDTKDHPYEGFLPSGKCSFILPDSIFRTSLPTIFERIDWSWPAEQMMATTSLIRNEKGTIFASAHLANIGIEIWVRFDKIQISDKRIEVILHSTDYAGKGLAKSFRYYQVHAVVKEINSKYLVRRMRVKEIACCDERREFSRALRRQF